MDAEKRRRNNLLTQYYGIAEETAVENNFDIDGKQFYADGYVDNIVKECNLKQLIDKERELVREIQSLDSDMQTLVYENYNKFILATDTIRQMKSDFKTMEDEMEKLVTEMSTIASSAGQISSSLQDRRQQITKLSDIHELLKNLQFLFDLPKKLNACVVDKNYSQAVKYYIKSRNVLAEFGDHPSFTSIRQDCQRIVQTLREELKQQFTSADVSSNGIREAANLLRVLEVDSSTLSVDFLRSNRIKLESELEALKQWTPAEPQDGDVVLSFVDTCSNGILNNVALTIATFNDIFAGEASSFYKSIMELSSDILDKVCSVVEARTIELCGSNTTDTGCVVVAAALDKFHRRLLAVQRLLSSDEQRSTVVVYNVCRAVTERFASALQDQWQQLLTEWRESSSETSAYDSVKQVEASLVERMQRALVALQAFIAGHITFSQSSQFRQKFSRLLVREDVVARSLKYLPVLLEQLPKESANAGKIQDPTLLLILSRVALDFSQQLTQTLISLTEEQFDIPPGFESDGLTTVSTLTQGFKTASQTLIQSFVHQESFTLAQMIRKSMDARDWLNAPEPRAVRPVVKRVLEELTRLDSQASQLFEEGSRKERGSDSSRRTLHSAARTQPKSSWSSYGPSQMDSSLLNNIQKLFSERIDLATPVEHSKASILMAVIKICLKGFLECVRLKTYGKYGVQQIQVDCYFLQLFLWRFSSDENLVHVLLDEILSSAVQRCLEPSLMESSVVELICEKT